MGNSLFGRENARIEEQDPTASNAYRFPPDKGNYFARHYIMAGERFKTFRCQSYLFGDNMDLNFLCSKPTPFPYPAPQPNEPTRTLRCLMNIRKESLRFMKAPESSERGRNSENDIDTAYNIEFTFDSDVKCGITIYYFCTEEVTSNGVIYTPKDMSMNSEIYYYISGVNQQFSQASHVFDPSKYSEDMLTYKFSDEIVPVLIQCVAEEGEEPKQSHALLAAVEKNADGTYTLKPLKQKIFVDGLYYVIQEVYGIENKNDARERERTKDASDDDVEESGSECVICMSEPRDTLILPCRHLCLCNNCADSLRYAASNCPICRVPFRALLQIRAVRKSDNTLPQASHNTENQPSQDIPPGYEPVSLIEALNGPMQPSASLASSFVPPQIPPFTNSPNLRPKHQPLKSSAAQRHSENMNSEKEDQSSDKIQGASEGSSVPEVASIISSEKFLKSESLSLTRGEGRRHRKGFRTSSAPEKMRLLTNSVQIVNEVGSGKRKIEKDIELAETKSLLESSVTAGGISVTSHTSPKTSRPCSENSPISLSTPHSLHLCEKSSKVLDTSSGGDDSDYYTPDDPSATILVDQGTDTSLDTTQGIEVGHTSDSLGKNRSEYPVVGKHKINRERPTIVNEVPIPDDNLSIHDERERESKRNSDPLKNTEGNEIHVKSSNCDSLVANTENPISLPETPASNHSSGDSFSSTSSSRLLLCPQNYDTLLE